VASALPTGFIQWVRQGVRTMAAHLADLSISALFETDERNRKTAYASVGAAAALPDDVVALYAMQYKALRAHLPDQPAQIAGILYVSCCKHFSLGVTSLFRRYASLAFRETRTAVEAAGIAYAIRQDPETFRIFREDRGRGESRKAARNRFKPAKLFTGKLEPLRAAYDRASELSHTNRRTFSPHLNLKENSFSYAYQDVSQKDIPKLLINYLLWICKTHLEILESADFVFTDVENEKTEKFKAERTYVAQRIVRFSLQNEGKYVGSPQ
jgi:hypothetical protein